MVAIDRRLQGRVYPSRIPKALVSCKPTGLADDFIWNGVSGSACTSGCANSKPSLTVFFGSTNESGASASSATPAKPPSQHGCGGEARVINRLLYFAFRFFAHRNFCAIEILRRAAADIRCPGRRSRRDPGLPCPFNAPIAAVIACNSRVAASCLASASFSALRNTVRMFIQRPSHFTVPQTKPGPRCPKAASTFYADSLV